MSIRAIRSLDGIALSVAFFLLLLIVPGAARDQLNRMTVMLVLPIFLVAWFGWRLPDNLLSAPAWQTNLVKLRLWSLAAAGFSPFIAWYFTTPTSAWFLISALLACYAGIATCFYINEVSYVVLKQLREAHWRRLAMIGRYGIMYFFFCSLTALSVHLVPGLINSVTMPTDFIAQVMYRSSVIYFIFAAVFACWLALIALCGLVMPLLASRTLQAHAVTTIPLPPQPADEEVSHE